MADDGSAQPAQRKRADARRNEKTLLDAAAAAFVDSGVDAPVLRGLSNVIEGKVEPERWTASLTAPRPAATREKVQAA